MENCPTPEDLVAKGTAFLDEIDPDWAKLVDLDEFEIDDPAMCVIGQTFCHWMFRERAGVSSSVTGAWTAGCLAMHDRVTPSAVPTDLGFEHDYAVVTYDELNTEWRKVIEERQAS